MERPIFYPVLRKHLVIGQRQKAPNSSAFRNYKGSIPKRTETSLLNKCTFIFSSAVFEENVEV